MSHQDHRYFADTYLFETAAEVLAAGTGADGTPWIAVSPNIFHPRGGGQPSDEGRVDGVAVAPERREGGLVALVAEPGAESARVGSRVVTAVEPATRLLHAALHTAGHLLGFAGEERGWTHTGHSHYPGQARLDFDPAGLRGELATPELREAVRAQLQERVDGLVAAGGAVTSRTDAEGVRTVTIEGVNAEPCGGTHVGDLSLLRDVRVLEVKIKRGALKVRYDAAHAEFAGHEDPAG
ncbi:alanyl-tRNA editing protein [Arthrobacter halodurans]|uniref:Threonyl/alanyl tRNA synthetase SAD domain-containing protein n=1 Tax=Arthrobacter halodurans TaxID=516699 RepID=A0ABV4UQM6_9MICC